MHFENRMTQAKDQAPVGANPAKLSAFTENSPVIRQTESKSLLSDNPLSDPLLAPLSVLSPDKSSGQVIGTTLDERVSPTELAVDQSLISPLITEQTVKDAVFYCSCLPLISRSITRV